MAAGGAGPADPVEEGSDRSAPGEACHRVGRAANGGAASVAGDGEGNVEASGGKAIPGALRPFDQRDTSGQRLVEADLVDLVRSGQPVEVEMGDRQSRQRIGLNQREGRARHLDARVVGDGADEGAGEGGLAGAEIAVERDHVAGGERRRHILGEGGGRRLVGEGDGEAFGDLDGRHCVLRGPSLRDGHLRMRDVSSLHYRSKHRQRTWKTSTSSS